MVSGATYEPPVLKGKVASGGKIFLSGLKISGASDVDNICPCKDSRIRGIICAHSVAVGLEYLRPFSPKCEAVKAEQPKAARGDDTTSEIPGVELHIEGSLRHLEAEFAFRYAKPGASNREAEAAACAELEAAGFDRARGKLVLHGEDRTLKFFASVLPSLKKKWRVRVGERFAHATRDLVRIEPHFAIREREDGWLDFHVHFTAGSDAVLSHHDVIRLLRGGAAQIRLKNGRAAVPDAEQIADLEQVLRDCAPEQDRAGYRVRPVHRAYLEASIAGWGGKLPSAAAEKIGRIGRFTRD